MATFLAILQRPLQRHRKLDRTRSHRLVLLGLPLQLSLERTLIKLLFGTDMGLVPFQLARPFTQQRQTLPRRPLARRVSARQRSQIRRRDVHYAARPPHARGLLRGHVGHHAVQVGGGGAPPALRRLRRRLQQRPVIVARRETPLREEERLLLARDLHDARRLALKQRAEVGADLRCVGLLVAEDGAEAVWPGGRRGEGRGEVGGYGDEDGGCNGG